MWRRSLCLYAPPKVLCLTMIPGGGAMTEALKQLGYTPYTFEHTFTGGRVDTHPQEWCMVLDKKKPFNPAILDPAPSGTSSSSSSTSKNDAGTHNVRFDALVGPPCTLAFEAILKECPLSTRVILVEEPDKEAWARDAAALWGPLLRHTERASRRRAGVHLHAMVVKMTAGMTGTNINIKEGKRVYGNLTSIKGNTMESAAAALEAFETRVRTVVPRDRLLVYRYGDGWEPLCRFLSIPNSNTNVESQGNLNTNSNTNAKSIYSIIEEMPFPARDTGGDVIAHLCERLRRVERVVLWATCGLAAAALVLHAPLWVALRDIVAAYHAEYRAAFEPILREAAVEEEKGNDSNSNSDSDKDNNGRSPRLTLRRALVLAKNTTMAFEAKWRERGGVWGATTEAYSSLATDDK
ncbi:uncharacterized protein TM35_000083390 [Trypanosoma theileri]|uniref:Uncharacterized protein n=1 Tax=Trypanosoma theileri TaxID=67003 RepID=A0A1X0P126_9TRYP|nr:uncharacterized protein TM35_000083390 [Trypanosoma theileri]ORC90541.1 hypothetical protein TM35_000083390 [Trypanosoma theileri]